MKEKEKAEKAGFNSNIVRLKFDFSRWEKVLKAWVSILI